MKLDLQGCRSIEKAWLGLKILRPKRPRGFEYRPRDHLCNPLPALTNLLEAGQGSGVGGKASVVSGRWSVVRDQELEDELDDDAEMAREDAFEFGFVGQHAFLSHGVSCRYQFQVAQCDAACVGGEAANPLPG